MTDTLALIAFGMALFRLGFFSGAWSTQTYRRIALWGFVICVPLHIPLILWNDADRFSPVTLHHGGHSPDAASTVARALACIAGRAVHAVRLRRAGSPIV